MGPPPLMSGRDPRAAGYCILDAGGLFLHHVAL